MGYERRSLSGGLIVSRVIRRLSFALCLWSVAGCQQLYEFPHREAYAELRSVQKGWTEQDIRTKLGVPDHHFAAGTPPSTYCIAGRACERREVTSKLLVYTRGKPVAYYFFDASGKVEHVYVGGS